MAKKRYIILILLMVVLAGGASEIYVFDTDDPHREKDWPDAIPGGRYDPRFP